MPVAAFPLQAVPNPKVWSLQGETDPLFNLTTFLPVLSNSKKISQEPSSVSQLVALTDTADPAGPEVGLSVTIGPSAEAVVVVVTTAAKAGLAGPTLLDGNCDVLLVVVVVPRVVALELVVVAVDFVVLWDRLVVAVVVVVLVLVVGPRSPRSGQRRWPC
jgi:hypothetical protein